MRLMPFIFHVHGHRASESPAGDDLEPAHLNDPRCRLASPAHNTSI